MLHVQIAEGVNVTVIFKATTSALNVPMDIIISLIAHVSVYKQTCMYIQK